METKEYREKRKKTFKGWSSKIYHRMRENAIKREMALPDFTLEEFRRWIKLNYWAKFNRLFRNWINRDCIKDLVPSVNRINDFKSYTFSNMELITWKENKEKGLNSKKTFLGRKLSGVKLRKPVLQIKDGKVIKEYISTREADRLNKEFKTQSISATCLGKQKTHKGFLWKYKEDYYQQSSDIAKQDIGRETILSSS